MVVEERMVVEREGEGREYIQLCDHATKSRLQATANVHAFYECLKLQEGLKSVCGKKCVCEVVS